MKEANHEKEDDGMEVEAPLPAHNLLAQKGAASSIIELTELLHSLQKWA